MSLYIVQHAILSGDSACPEECESDDPVYCHECGQEWDYQDNTLSFTRAADGEIYCTEQDTPGGSCFRKAERRSYCEQMRTRLLPKLREVKTLLEMIHHEHGDAFRGDSCDPTSEFEDLMAEVESL